MDDLSGIELRHLRYFTAVAKAGTVTEAARALRIAQPSLSQQIRTLERRLGADLFTRGPSGMTLTEAGRTLLERADRVDSELRAAVTTIRGAARPARIGVCRGVEQEVLVAAEQIITNHHPVRLLYDAADSHEQTALLQAGELDFGVLRAPFGTTGLVARDLATEELGVVLSLAHPLADRSELSWADLAGQRLLSFPESHPEGYATSILTHLAANGWPVTTTPGDHDHSSHTLFRHALLSGGNIVALRPPSTVADDSGLTWIPVGPHPPREQLVLAAAAGTVWGRTLMS